MPTKDEMVQMHLQLHKKNIGNFVRDFYWTVEEKNSSEALYFSFDDGGANFIGKLATFYIRPVRTLKFN